MIEVPNPVTVPTCRPGTGNSIMATTPRSFICDFNCDSYPTRGPPPPRRADMAQDACGLPPLPPHHPPPATTAAAAKIHWASKDSRGVRLAPLRTGTAPWHRFGRLLHPHLIQRTRARHVLIAANSCLQPEVRHVHDRPDAPPGRPPRHAAGRPTGHEFSSRWSTSCTLPKNPARPYRFQRRDRVSTALAAHWRPLSISRTRACPSQQLKGVARSNDAKDDARE
jgi:hypothetical protein